jgi:hypothetical protein
MCDGGEVKLDRGAATAAKAAIHRGGSELRSRCEVLHHSPLPRLTRAAYQTHQRGRV